MAAAAAAGCSRAPSGAGAAQPGQAPGWQRYAAEKITLNWYINFSWFSTTWGENLVAKTITDETGVSVNFIVPTGSEREKLDAMISSGDLPDLLTLGFWEPQVAQMEDEGLVYALNELAGAHDPWFFEVADTQRLSWYTRPDGNIYSYPNSSYSPADYELHDNIGSNQAFLVRADIYEALGSPDMTTPGGFCGAAEKALAEFPSVGGLPLRALGLYDFNKEGNYSLEEILMNFLALPFEKGGAKYDRYTDPDYIMWLKMFRRLNEKGLLGDDLYLDRREQVAEKVAAGQYFCMFYQHTDIADQQLHLYNKDPKSAYIAVDGPMNGNRDRHTLQGVGINGWTVTMISKNCKAPGRAVAFMSYLMSGRGQKLTYCGVEGVTYDEAENGGLEFRGEAMDLLGSDRAEYNRVYGADNTYWMMQDTAMQLDWQPPPRPPLAQPREWTFPYTVYMPEYDVSITEANAAEANRLIREEWGRTLPALLLAPDDGEFDRLLEQFVEKRAELGFELVNREWMRLVTEARQKLGLT